MRLKNKIINRVIILTLLVLMLINSVPIKTYAHDAYFFQVLIDENSMLYMGNVVKDKNPWYKAESNHIEAQLWKYLGGSLTTTYENLEGDNNGKSSMPFTFPPKSHERKLGLEVLNSVTSKDIDRAFEIMNTLVPTLNDILLIINDGKKYKSVEELIDVSEKVIINESGGTYNGWNVKYIDGGDKVVVSNNDTGESYEFIARMKKGYLDETLEDGRKSPVYNPEFDYSDSGYDDYISLGMIAMQGNYAYKVKGHLAKDMGEYSKPGTLEVKISELLTDFTNGIRSLLGLQSIDELLYNKRTRSTSKYYGGIMPMEWMEKATTFHMIFQATTWIILTVAILKLLFEKNLSTINPAMRVSLMDGIKNLIITGFMLISVLLVINTLININEKIVSIFATTAPDYGGFTGISNDYQTFAGAFLQIYYLFISIYLNFVYIIRALTTAILIAAAPIFIATIAFGNKSKTLFEAWIRELVANIFLQSFHAFVFSIFLNIQMGTRGIETAVISFALIPTTNWFKGLIIGNSGGVVGQIGSNIFSTATSAVGGFVGATMGSKAGKGGGKGSESHYANTGDNIKTKDSSKIPGVRENPERREHSTTPPNINTTLDSVSKMETDLKDFADVSSYSSSNDGNDNINVESSNYEKLSNRFFKDTGNIEKGDGKGFAKSMGKAALKTAAGAAKVGTGAALTMAMVGATEDAKVGINLMNSGFRTMKNAGKETAGEVATFGKKAINTALEKIHPNQNGNILGIERTSSGNTVVHRDKAKVAENGVVDVVKTSDNNVAFTYNREKLSEVNRQYLSKIEEAYKNQDMEYLKRRGIEKVTTRGDGNITVHYNKHGQENLGFIDIYQAGNRIVETKSPGQKLHTDIIYDIDNIPLAPPTLGGGSSNTYNK